VKTELEITRCDFATLISETGLNLTSCVSRQGPDTACGQPTELELRLRPVVVDPETARSRCAALPFTKVLRADTGERLWQCGSCS
jgi:hypothetical protein